MERNIKFEVWDSQHESTYTCSRIHWERNSDGELEYKFWKWSGIEMDESLGDRLSRCTGLKDRYDTLIYEDDVITAYGDENFVYFQDGAFWVNLDDTKGVTLLGNIPQEEIEVIGKKFNDPNYNQT